VESLLRNVRVSRASIPESVTKEYENARGSRCIALWCLKLNLAELIKNSMGQSERWSGVAEAIEIRKVSKFH
jgi:hypothetical protein